MNSATCRKKSWAGNADPTRFASLGLLLLVGVWLLLVSVCGCKSAYVEADVKNLSGAAVGLVEVDYPSASFGVESLANGATYHYRFKILGDGPTKVMWTDAVRKDHSAPGPKLKEGQQGTLVVTIGPSGGTAWQTTLRP